MTHLCIFPNNFKRRFSRKDIVLWRAILKTRGRIVNL